MCPPPVILAPPPHQPHLSPLILFWAAGEGMLRCK